MPSKINRKSIKEMQRNRVMGLYKNFTNLIVIAKALNGPKTKNPNEKYIEPSNAPQIKYSFVCAKNNTTRTEH